MNIEDEAWEYYECIVIAELAMYMARAHGEYESKAIRNCCTQLLKRIKSKRIRLIFKGLRKSMYPVGALATLRGNFDDCCEEQNACSNPAQEPLGSTLREIPVGEVFEYNNVTFIRIEELKLAVVQSTGESLEHVVAVSINTGRFLSIPEQATEADMQATVHLSATMVVES